MTLFGGVLTTMNACMLVGTGAMAVWLWVGGSIAVGTVAMALPLAWQIANMAGWVAQNVTQIFENVGVVQDGMRSIAVPRQMPDRPNATALRVTRGAVRFEDVHFGYGTTRGVLHGIEIDIAPGERVGLVGPSGAGNRRPWSICCCASTRSRAGRILIDGTDIASVTCKRVCAPHIAMVTQDTSLLHRSIADNIRYGRPEASDDEVRAAAARAHALEFIEGLEDWQHRHGFDAHVGERGVKLSGGQRQRVALARVILKNAPILILDEATSALDSEVEAAIQGAARRSDAGPDRDRDLAHRLSTISRMDRLIVLDQGRVVEDRLACRAGAARRHLCAGRWRRQSGGFDIRDASLEAAIAGEDMIMVRRLWLLVALILGTSPAFAADHVTVGTTRLMGCCRRCRSAWRTAISRRRGSTSSRSFSIARSLSPSPPHPGGIDFGTSPGPRPGSTISRRAGG